MADLAVIYFPLVEKIARKVKAKTLKDIELDDLVGYGSIGLMKAVKGHDPEKGNFAPYAGRRIFGEIIDNYRQHELYFARGAVEANKGLCLLPDNYDVAGENETLREAENRDYWRKCTQVYSLETQIILLHFRNNMKFTEIADVLGLSACYVRVIYKAAIQRLRDKKFKNKYRVHPLIRVCCVKGCSQPYDGCGYCRNHLERWRRCRDVNLVPINRNHNRELHHKTIFSVERGCKARECQSPHHCKGFCNMHYQRMLRAKRKASGLPSVRQQSYRRVADRKRALNAELPPKVHLVEPVLAVQELVADFDRLELPEVLENLPGVEIGAGVNVELHELRAKLVPDVQRHVAGLDDGDAGKPPVPLVTDVRDVGARD